MGRILKFKNNGLNLKEPCLYENLVLKRIKIIKNFLNETYKFNNIVDQLNQIPTNYPDIPAELSLHCQIKSESGMLFKFDELIQSLNNHIYWNDDGNGIPNVKM